VVKDQRTKESFVELRAKGLSYDKIAVELKVSRQTLITWSKELTTEIGNLRAIETDALYEKCFVGARERISLLAGQLEKVRDELMKRDLSTVPTEKLLDAMLKYSSALRDEYVPLSLSESRSVDPMEFSFTTLSTTTWAP